MHRVRSASLRLAAALVLLAAFIPLRAASASTESLRPALSKIAAAVSQILKSRGAESISIGSFSGPPNFAASSGPGIQKILAEEFQSLGVSVKKFGAGMGLRGEYLYTTPVGQDGGTFKQIRLQVMLTDSSGQALSTLNQEVEAKVNDNGFEDTHKIDVKDGKINLDTFKGGAEAAALLGVTYDFEKNGLSKFIDKDVVADSFANPSADLFNGRAVRSSRVSPFFLEVFVNGQPRAITLEEGQPFVQLNKGEAFTLRFTNRAQFEVATFFTLDGVSNFAFSRERKKDGSKFTRFFVASNTPFELKGWHITHQVSTEFKVTDFSESAAALVGSESGLGQITVVAHASWKKGENPPPSEPRNDFGDGALAAAPPPGIGFGKEVEQKTQEVDPRELGVVRSIITIRYNRE